MNTNDPGREPEPTDAELLREWAGTDRLRMASAANHSSFKQYSLACENDANAHRAAIARGREYLSGARPMPDTPAPDEVAQLRAEVARLKDEVKKWQRIRKPGHGACCTCQQCGLEYDDCRCSLDETVDANIALTARIADLERENAALGAERDGMKESCRIVLGFGKAIISDASINGILDGAPTTLLFQTVDEEHTIGMDATGYGRDNLEPGDGNVQIVFTKAESVDVVIDTLVKIKGAIEAAVSAVKEAPDAGI